MLSDWVVSIVPSEHQRWVYTARNEDLGVGLTGVAGSAEKALQYASEEALKKQKDCTGEAETYALKIDSNIDSCMITKVSIQD